MMKELNFICGGKMGDLIHYSFYIKNICEHFNQKGILHLTNNKKFGGDDFTLDIETSCSDIKKLYENQTYIQNVKILNEQDVNDSFINMNFWRKERKNRSWAEFIKKDLKLKYKKDLSITPWININNKFEKLTDKVVIHRSIHRHSKIFPWEYIVENNECFFITSNLKEYEIFPFKNKVNLFLCKDLLEMGIAINSSKFFIGNLSTPNAIAHAIHKPRIFELDNIHYNQFIGENKYYDNYSHLGDKAEFINKKINTFINFFKTETRENPPKSKY